MIIALGNLADTHLKLGNFAEALPLCEEGLAAAARCEAIRRTDDGTIKFQSYLGEIHLDPQRFWARIATSLMCAWPHLHEQARTYN